MARARRFLTAAVAAGLVAVTLPGIAAADCEPVLPVADVTTGMTATGWTVARGRTPVPFDVEVLGVATDGLGPGRDLIVVEVASPEVDAAGGIWAGMSGSPVYAPGGELIGAVGYGFSFAGSKIGGVTPAQDMVNLLGLPSSRALARPVPKTVELDRELARTVARTAGVTVAEASTLARLRVPLAVSGLDSVGLGLLTRNFAHRRADGLVPFVAGSTSASSPLGFPPAAGENFAAALAYGNVSMTAMGTTTYVCGGQALAFGHPFLHGGPAHLGANAADAFAVVPDPVYGPFKFGQAAEPVGVVDQDRLAGVRASLGVLPETIPIETTVHVPELGVDQTATTDLVANDQAGFLTFASMLSVFGAAFDAVGGGFDTAGRGTARVWWTFEGERADGTPWRLARGNRFASRSAAAVSASFNPGFMLDALIWLPEENVKVTSVKVDATIEKAVRVYRVARVLMARGNRPLEARRSVAARPGAKYRFRVVLRQFEGGTRNLDFTFRLPKNLGRFASIGFLSNRQYWLDDCAGGFCFPRDEFFFSDAVTLDEWLAVFRSMPRDDELRIVLNRGIGRGGGLLGGVRLDGVVVGGARVSLRR